MTTLVERTIRAQRKNLKRAHNARFHLNGMEYRIVYDGGVGEYMSVYGRKNTERFRFIDGFHAYKLHSAEEVVDTAKRKVFKP